MQTDIVKRLYETIDTYTDQLIEWQKHLVSIQAIGPENGGEGEVQKSLYVKTILKDIGFDEVLGFNAPDDRVPGNIRPNIAAKIFGNDPQTTVWILAHLDVVPAGDLKYWQSDPFQLVVDGDKLVGRGVEDNHQGLVSALLAVKALREHGVTPSKNVGLVIVSDEESGSQYGLEYLLKHHQDVFKPDDLIIVPDAGDPKGITLEVSEKSIMWIKFHIKGTQCHASTPQFGINAHRAAAHLAVELDSLYSSFPIKDNVYDTPYSTFEPTKKEANVPNINTIPGEDVFYLDCRILPDYTIAQVEEAIHQSIEKVKKRFQVEIDISFPQKEQAAPPTANDAPVVQTLARAIRDVKAKDPQIVGIGGGTVASFFRRAGFPAVVWGTIADTCHQPNEYALISNTLDDAKVLSHVFVQ